MPVSGTFPLRPATMPRPGAELAALLDWPGDLPDISGVSLDSRRVVPGDLYAALAGEQTHGARFAPAAVSAGAVAILTDPAGQTELSRLFPGEYPVPVVIAADPRGKLGEVSAWAYGYPARSLRTVGITGTNGKTTTAYLLAAGLQAGGLSTGLIGTVATLIGSEVLPSARTTPEAPDLQALLAVMVERGVQAVAMEVSSHALALGRVDGLTFDVALFTNFSQDHLDFHGTLEAYFAAKAELFTPARARWAAVCTDEEWGARLAAQIRMRSDLPVVTFGLAGGADWNPHNLHTAADGSTHFEVTGPVGHLAAAVRLPGSHNAANALAALIAAVQLGVEPAVAAAGIAECPGVPGRMELIRETQPFLAVVDYAHSPDSVSRAIAAGRVAARGKVIVVLGAGGDRDRAKRPIMGRLAAELADVVIVADDNPRSEPRADIRAAVLGGAREVPEDQRAEVQEVGDRAAAITRAVLRARPGDAVLVLGKGHEQGQEVAGVVTPFDDRVELRRAIGEWLAGQEESK
ncbi:MAG: UDP-N-acetylmuramoyl-L-alanyl-D-glutamate--2,6-diaminopimelate ligase [Candidatus Nanopelagicales bacterium]